MHILCKICIPKNILFLATCFIQNVLKGQGGDGKHFGNVSQNKRYRQYAYSFNTYEFILKVKEPTNIDTKSLFIFSIDVLF